MTGRLPAVPAAALHRLPENKEKFTRNTSALYPNSGAGDRCAARCRRSKIEKRTVFSGAWFLFSQEYFNHLFVLVFLGKIQ
jgi:hypothetical protein